MEHEKQTQQKTRLLGERKNLLLVILSGARCYGDEVSHVDGEADFILPNHKYRKQTQNWEGQGEITNLRSTLCKDHFHLPKL